MTTPAQQVLEAIREAITYAVGDMPFSCIDILEKVAIPAAQKLVEIECEAVSLDDLAIGDCIEYRNGWIAKVFDLTDIAWLGEIGKKRASARVWSRAEGQEWYHTHRRDGVSTTDGDCDIQRIIKAKGRATA